MICTISLPLLIYFCSMPEQTNTIQELLAKCICGYKISKLSKPQQTASCFPQHHWRQNHSLQPDPHSVSEADSLSVEWVSVHNIPLTFQLIKTQRIKLHIWTAFGGWGLQISAFLPTMPLFRDLHMGGDRQEIGRWDLSDQAKPLQSTPQHTWTTAWAVGSECFHLKLSFYSRKTEIGHSYPGYWKMAKRWQWWVQGDMYMTVLAPAFCFSGAY